MGQAPRGKFHAGCTQRLPCAPPQGKAGQAGPSLECDPPPPQHWAMYELWRGPPPAERTSPSSGLLCCEAQRWQAECRPAGFYPGFWNTKSLDNLSSRILYGSPLTKIKSIPFPDLPGPTCPLHFSELPLTLDTVGSILACHSSYWASCLPPLTLFWSPALECPPDSVLPSGSPATATPSRIMTHCFCALGISAITGLLTPSSNHL